MKHLYAVTTMGVITNISYDHEGQVKWCKAVFDTKKEAYSRADYLNELGHSNYIVQPIAVKIRKGESV